MKKRFLKISPRCNDGSTEVPNKGSKSAEPRRKTSYHSSGTLSADTQGQDWPRLEPPGPRAGLCSQVGPLMELGVRPGSPLCQPFTCVRAARLVALTHAPHTPHAAHRRRCSVNAWRRGKWTTEAKRPQGISHAVQQKLSRGGHFKAAFRLRAQSHITRWGDSLRSTSGVGSPWSHRGLLRSAESTTSLKRLPGSK